ncbi:hypothetical protein JRQ81_009012, partial [Phrynocephalus forsythii]
MAEASVGRQSPRVVSYAARNLCPARPSLHTTAVVSMGSADHRFNLAEILSRNYGVVREEADEVEEDEEQEPEQGKGKAFEDLDKSFHDSQSSDMPFEELLALYGYEASDPVSEQESESASAAPNLPDMTLDKEQIAKDLLSGKEEEETQSSADDLTPSVTSHDASDLFPSQRGSNFLADEDKGPCSSPCASFSAEDSEEDSLPPNDCKKEIMVGPQYQAAVPFLHLNRHSEKVYENDDQLLWDPNMLPEKEVEEFLYRAVKRRWDGVSHASLPEGESVKDNEQALYELVKCNFNAEEALRRLRFNVKVIRDELCSWSEEECRNFEHGFRVHGKNFHLIQANKVRTRSVGECVEYYYIWKKSERYDYFTQQTRFGRKKDYADNFLDGGEVENANRSRGSPPISAVTGCIDSRFNPDHLAMDSTEPLSIESATCSLGSASESGHGYECGTLSETNCAFDPAEEAPAGSRRTPFLQPPPESAETGFFPVAASTKPEEEEEEEEEPLRCSGKAVSVDLTLPGSVTERLPLIAGHVGLGRAPEARAPPGQVSLTVPDFSLIGIGDVNSFLAAPAPGPAPGLLISVRAAVMVSLSGTTRRLRRRSHQRTFSKDQGDEGAYRVAPMGSTPDGEFKAMEEQINASAARLPARRPPNLVQTPGSRTLAQSGCALHLGGPQHLFPAATLGILTDPRDKERVPRREVVTEVVPQSGHPLRAAPYIQLHFPSSLKRGMRPRESNFGLQEEMPFIPQIEYCVSFWAKNITCFWDLLPETHPPTTYTLQITEESGQCREDFGRPSRCVARQGEHSCGVPVEDFFAFYKIQLIVENQRGRGQSLEKCVHGMAIVKLSPPTVNLLLANESRCFQLGWSLLGDEVVSATEAQYEIQYRDVAERSWAQ